MAKCKSSRRVLSFEGLEDRVALSAVHAAAGDHAPVFYRGDGLHTPGHLVPQDQIAGPGVDSPGQADGGGGTLLAVFGPFPA